MQVLSQFYSQMLLKSGHLNTQGLNDIHILKSSEISTSAHLKTKKKLSKHLTGFHILENTFNSISQGWYLYILWPSFIWSNYESVTYNDWCHSQIERFQQN